MGVFCVKDSFGYLFISLTTSSNTKNSLSSYPVSQVKF